MANMVCQAEKTQGHFRQKKQQGPKHKIVMRFGFQKDNSGGRRNDEGQRTQSHNHNGARGRGSKEPAKGFIEEEAAGLCFQEQMQF